MHYHHHVLPSSCITIMYYHHHVLPSSCITIMYYHHHALPSSCITIIMYYHHHVLPSLPPSCITIIMHSHHIMNKHNQTLPFLVSFLFFSFLLIQQLHQQLYIVLLCRSE